MLNEMSKNTCMSINPSLCSGCNACYNICPKQAIMMQENVEGFKYPQIDKKKCINCGLCLKVCPINIPQYKNNPDPDCFAAAANDSLRQDSSSGAIFPLLALSFLKNGGVVCGAAFNESMEVEHIIIDNEDDLTKLKGSKYVQSNTKKCYSQIAKLLNKGNNVLFSGTPCQVAALNAFLQKKYDNLLTIDIVCHGTPSPLVYKKYLSELTAFNNEKILNTNFRNKIKGWTPYYLTTKTTITTYSTEVRQSDFMQAFLKNLSLRKSCATCPFATLPRQGDITLGDFWKIEKYNSKLNDNKGTSLVLINSDKGNSCFKQIKNQLKFCKKVPIKYAIKGNPSLISTSKLHPNRDIFFNQLSNVTLKENVALCLGKKFDCGILNFWYTNNYGALLNCYALQESIKKLGLTPRVINYVKNRKTFNGRLSDTFSQNWLDLTEPCDNEESLKKLNQQTKIFVAGSDQIWRHRYFWGQGKNIFQLNFANTNAKKIAYAASFGTDEFEGNPLDTSLTKCYLQRFDAISVREDDGVDICNNTFCVDATHVLDPVFLPEAKDWDKMIEKSECQDKNFIASYVLDKSEHADKLIEEICKKAGITHTINMVNANQNKNCKENVEDWLYAIKNCRFFITDSFHGACFAIIFNKPFICLANIARGYSRFKSLFKVFGLENRCVLSADDIKNKQNLFDDIDYTKVNAILEKEKERSLKWLKDALLAPKATLDPNVLRQECLFDILLEKINGLEKQIALSKNEVSVSSYRSSKIKYWRYKILSKITFGKTRKKYKQKRKELKIKLKAMKNNLKAL